MSIITSSQLEQYQTDGFLVLPNFVDGEQCDELRDRANQLVRHFDPRGVTSIFTTNQQSRVADEYFFASSDEIHFFFEEQAFLKDGTLRQSKEESINKIGHALHDIDPVFRNFSRSPKIEKLTSDLGIGEPLLIQSMYIFKQPNIGGEVNCHQDSTFLYTDPICMAGLWFAIEDATLSNGCLWALPGGHRDGLKSRWIRNSEDRMEFETYDTTPWDENGLVPLEVSKGTLILLHGLLPHRSMANTSTHSRHAYTLHVISAGSNYPTSNWLQRKSPARGFQSPR